MSCVLSRRRCQVVVGLLSATEQGDDQDTKCRQKWAFHPSNADWGRTNRWGPAEKVYQGCQKAIAGEAKKWLVEKKKMGHLLRFVTAQKNALLDASFKSGRLLFWHVSGVFGLGCCAAARKARLFEVPTQDINCSRAADFATKVAASPDFQRVLSAPYVLPSLSLSRLWPAVALELSLQRLPCT